MTHERAQGDVVGAAVDAQTHVGGGTDLQTDTRGDDRVQQRGVLTGAYPVAQTRGAECGDDLAQVVGSQELSAVRHGGQATPPGDGEGPLPRSGPSGALVVGQAEADNLTGLVPGVAHRQACEGARVQGVAHPGGRYDDGHFHTGQGRSLLGGVEDDLQGRGDPSDEGGVAGRVDLDLQAS